MKRIRIFLLLTLLLLGCVQTPDTEYIVSKADGVLEQKLAASPVPIVLEWDEPISSASMEALPSEAPASPTPAPVRFPDRWEETRTLGSHLTVRIDADIRQKPDGVYPVYRTASAAVTEADVARYAETLLLEQPVSETADEPTKAELTEEFKTFLQEVDAQREWVAQGRPSNADRDETVWSEEDVEQISADYAASIAAAPEQNESHPFTGYRDLGPRVFHHLTLASGEQAELHWDETYVSIGRGGATFYPKSEYEFTLSHPEEDDPFAKLWKPVTLSYTDAALTLTERLRALGLDSFTIAEAEEAMQISGRTVTQSGWIFTLARDYTGYPHQLRTNAATRFDYEEEPAAMNRPINSETIRAFVAQDGVRYFEYNSPKTVLGLENANVSLLSYSEVQDRLWKALEYGLASYNERGYDVSFTVYEAVLTVRTLRVRNSDEYYEMPCWVFPFTRTRPDGVYGQDHVAKSAVILNAVDGSIVRPETR